MLNEDEDIEEDEEKPTQNLPQTTGINLDFIKQMMQQQELLSEMKFKSHAEITEIKLNGMKAQFEEMLKAKEQIYLEKLDIEREKVKLESGIETESVLMESFKNVLEELTPHIGKIIEVYLAKSLSSPTKPVIKRI